MDELWPECETILKKYFVYEKIFNLYSYVNNFDQLKDDLSLYKKNNYDANYRFIFLHYDTEYYLYPNVSGLFLTNLQRLLVKLDIPNYFCIVITNHYNIKEDLLYLQKNFTKDEYPIGSIICQLQNVHVTKKLEACELNANLNYNFSCLNKSKRSHRSSLIGLLNYKKLLSNGLISYVN